MQRKIQELDIQTRSKIRSTQILASLPQVISELVQNSLDAGASQVDIGVNYEEWSCWVRDDGSGFRKDDLCALAGGFEVGRYTTSKAYNPTSLDEVSTFGFRGEALSSMADLCLLEICSRTARAKETTSLIQKGGEKLYFGPAVRWLRERAGTTVSVKDAFYNLPIRRNAHPNASRTLELVKREVETLALISHNVSFSIEDSAKTLREGSGKGRILTIPKTQSILSAFRHIFGRALVEHVEELDECREFITIKGFLSLVGAHSKSHQFLYINRHLLDTCDLHRTIEQQFGKSTFSKHAFDESGGNEASKTTTRRSPRKGERKPVYVLSLDVPRQEIDNCLEPAKAAVHMQNQGRIVSFLADVIQNFLHKHGFMAATAESTKSREHLDKRKRVDSSEGGSTIDERTLRSITSKRPARELYVHGHPDAYEIAEGTFPESEEISWTDPATGRIYKVDPRTGNSYLWNGKDCEQDDKIRDRHLTRRTLTKKPRLDGQDGQSGQTTPIESMPTWIQDALQANATYASTERGIKRIPEVKRTVINEDGIVDDKRRQPKRWTDQVREALTAASVAVDARATSFSKESLSNAQVIEQVDRKFIACLVGPNTQDESAEGNDDNDATLVLIDQHAADERIRVEHFLKEICTGFLDRDEIGVGRRLLDPPVSVLVTTQERDKLLSSDRMRREFGYWGFDICTDIPAEEKGQDSLYGQLYLSGLPDVVADKLLAGDDLREFIKGYLARLDAGDFSSSDSLANSADDEHAWLRALRHCPRELVELVNSKACRGAIMFNDFLTIDQCKRLIQKLSKTAFSFQCAHGRPSVVPLVSMEQFSRGDPKPVDWSRLLEKTAN
ncbi:hypothetical protein SCHPADRAFT_938373 [Schizopora paradoxa]|uniref:MutL C-terminal dimerisation domain-containing protein n=1 Tax=Schizopora paradoxa TaxID=27342 RepID=A0A0H2RVS4_9AGAM|nr:hypothetical protein SCHPADRAFT_938373 [Schizopora paradoxa]